MAPAHGWRDPVQRSQPHVRTWAAHRLCADLTQFAWRCETPWRGRVGLELRLHRRPRSLIVRTTRVPRRLDAPLEPTDAVPEAPHWQTLEARPVSRQRRLKHLLTAEMGQATWDLDLTFGAGRSARSSILLVASGVPLEERAAYRGRGRETSIKCGPILKESPVGEDCFWAALARAWGLVEARLTEMLQLRLQHDDADQEKHQLQSFLSEFRFFFFHHD